MPPTSTFSSLTAHPPRPTLFPYTTLFRSPIHMSGLSAKAFGFPRAIAHGMYTASRAFTEARVDLSRPLRWDVSFDAPVTLPGTVLVSYAADREAGTVECGGWRPGRRDEGPRRGFEVQIQTRG